jgi:hypothetical protein
MWAEQQIEKAMMEFAIDGNHTSKTQRGLEPTQPTRPTSRQTDDNVLVQLNKDRQNNPTRPTNCVNGPFKTKVCGHCGPNHESLFKQAISNVQQQGTKKAIKNHLLPCREMSHPAKECDLSRDQGGRKRLKRK